MNLKADNDKIINYSQLPSAAQTLIEAHFTNVAVTLIKEETDFLKRSYTVFFENGVKAEFNKKGEWEELKSSAEGDIPQALVPAKIATFLNRKYPKVKILSIEIDDDSREFEVKLTNGISLEFDRHQKLVDID